MLSILVLLVFIIGCAEKAQESNIPIKDEAVPALIQKEAAKNDTAVEEQININQESKEMAETGDVNQPSWKYGGIAISGKYADADIIELSSGKYRLYYSPEPEIPGFKGQVYSAVSSDGKSWVSEEDTNLEWATFPSLIKLQDGRCMIYFQNQGAIKSAISNDCKDWKEESGIRVDVANNLGLKLENVAAPSVIKQGDSYLMVYRGTIDERYSNNVPNQNTQLFFWATSKDGLSFEKKGIALDSRNSEFMGLLDGPELVEWDDGLLRLYFWSYKGIYHTVFKDNRFSEDTEFDYTTSTDKRVPMPENPPSDPTLAKIDKKWFMYYGQHEKGIYYATLES